MKKSNSSAAVESAKVILLVVSIFISACGGMKSRSDLKTADAAKTGKPSLMEDQPGEVSLTADRSELADFRKDIPEEVKKSNDEIAMMMSFIARESEEEPNRLRDRFSTALRKKREATDKKIRRAREDFTKHERAEREVFLKKSKDTREGYLSGSKRTADERKSFFETQDDKRKSFFADQSEKQKDFEQHVQEERKGVEDFNREKQNAFNQEWRAYQTRYNERKKQTDLKKRMEDKSRELERNGKPVSPVTAPAETGLIESSTRPTNPLAEFDQIPPGPASPLVPGEKGP